MQLGRPDEATSILQRARERIGTDRYRSMSFSVIDRMLGVADAARGDHSAALVRLGSARRYAEMSDAPLEMAKIDLIAAAFQLEFSGPKQWSIALDLALPAWVFIDAQRFQFARAASRAQWLQVHGAMRTVTLSWAARAGNATLVADLVEMAINSGCHVSAALGTDSDYLTAISLLDAPPAAEPDTSRRTGGAAGLIASATLPLRPPPRLRMPDGRRALSPYVEAADRRYRIVDRPADVSTV